MHPQLYALALAQLLLLNAHAVDVAVQVQAQFTSSDGNDVQGFKHGIAAAGALAVKHFNDRDTTIIKSFDETCDVQIVAYYEDTGSTDIGALGVYLEELPRPEAVIGALTSFETVPLAIATAVEKVPLVSYGATSTSLDDEDKYPNFFRTIPSDATVAWSICYLFKDYFEYENVAVLYVDDSYGSAYKDALEANCGGSLLSAGVNLKPVAFRTNDADSIQAAVDDIASLGVNVVVAIAFPEDLPQIVASGGPLNLFNSDRLWIFSDAADLPSMQDLAKNNEQLRNALNGNLRVLATGTPAGDAGYEAFQSYWRDLSTQDIAYVQQAFGEVTDRDYTQFPFNTNAVVDSATTFMYDAVMAVGMAACRNTTDIIAGLGGDNTKFQGASGGTVEFTPNGSRDPASSYFVVQNLLMNDANGIDAVEVGFISKDQDVLLQNVTYADGTNQFPADVVKPEPDYNYISDATRITGIAMSCSLVVLSIVFLVWIFVNSRTRVVVHSQREFLITLLVGVVISALAIIPLNLDDQNVSIHVASIMCMLAPWLYSIGFVVAFAALFAKTYRISKLFNNKKMLKIIIKSKDLFRYITALVLLDGAVLMTWTLVSPLVFRRKVVSKDNFGNLVESYGTCVDLSNYENNGQGVAYSYVFLGVIAFIHFLLLVQGNYLTYTARHGPTSFQESKWIGFSMASNLQLFAIGIPGIFAVAGDPSAKVFVMSGVIFINNLVLILAIFGPKIHALWSNQTGAESSFQNSGTAAGGAGSYSLGSSMRKGSFIHSATASAGADTKNPMFHEEEDDLYPVPDLQLSSFQVDADL